MGEGMTIGFNGMKGATIIGTPMAGLLGPISNFHLTETKIGYQFCTELLVGRPTTAKRFRFAPLLLMPLCVPFKYLRERLRVPKLRTGSARHFLTFDFLFLNLTTPPLSPKLPPPSPHPAPQRSAGDSTSPYPAIPTIAQLFH